MCATKIDIQQYYSLLTQINRAGFVVFPRPVAMYAVRAAANEESWGEFAARRYAERRNVPKKLYELARTLNLLGPVVTWRLSGK